MLCRRPYFTDVVLTAGQHTDGELAKTMIAAFVLVVFPLTEAFLPLSDALGEVPGYQDSIRRMNKVAPQLGVPNQISG